MANRLHDGEQEFCDSAFSIVKTMGINKCLNLDYKENAKEILAYFMARAITDKSAVIKGDRLRLLRGLTKLILLEDGLILNSTDNSGSEL